ncbi:PepSY-associated TM helix domain-containing protein [Streptomonospora wellingtoniae]|uniref:PepSY-associated TM helix domain-containing protein n=1 Tax=Streptomonospora wellingtoniae TaxID=3075544 RepID=A0ABU2KR97_9ACTN|nr:PepSY-associated TM helix domain-containing protein [Streptomonospora sp. DSM 45055]MDT0301785.1 PepSY-associated TM helix domain-containing protein [Streptomonospora sp. DSM 45055]
MGRKTDTPAQDVPPSGSDHRRAWAALRPLVLRLHFYAGVFIAPFILVAAVSGLLYVWTPQIEQAVFAEQLRVAPSGDSLALSEQVGIAEAELPDAELDAVRPATAEEDSTRVLFNVPELEGSHRMTVFVDPHGGEVLGVMETYGTSGALPVRTWTDMLHRSLHMGDFGRHYSELAASWMWLVALGGVVLWVSRRWRAGGGVRGVLVPGAGTSRGRGRSMSVHGATGLWLLLGLLFLSATGMTWSQYAGANISDLRERLAWSTPVVSTEAPADSGDAGANAGGDAGVDSVLAGAREAGLDGPVEVVMPEDGASTYVVNQVDRSWPTRVDSAAVSAETAEVTDVVRFADYPLMAKLSRWGIDAHMGVLFGLPNQLLLTALAGGLITVIVMGYRMWWQRRPTRSGALGVGRPFPRGSFRALPLGYKLAVVVLLALIGGAVPLLGVTLLLFLTVDVLLGWRARARSPRTPGPDARREDAEDLQEAAVPPQH